MEYSRRFETALRSADAGAALEKLVMELAANGKSREAVYDVFHQFLLIQRKSPDYREEDEELLLGFMDALTDRCHPSAWLLADK